MPEKTLDETLVVAAAQGAYQVRFARGPEALAEFVSERLGDRPRLLVTDAGVAGTPWYAATRAVLAPDAEAVRVVAAGEATKSFAGLEGICRALARRALPRDGAVVALGGGVVGDLAGFAAAIYLRGISVLQVPTTLLAMLDASVGGKTAIDLPEGKNLVGAFHAPIGVFVDVALLETLPAREYTAALGELAKYALIEPAWLEQLPADAAALGAREPRTLGRVVRQALGIKARIVADDEHETAGTADPTGGRAALNLGHTLGHALEAFALAQGQPLLHGEAVALGLDFAVRWARALGMLPAGRARSALGLLAAFGLTRDALRPPLPAEVGALVPYLARDKKARAAAAAAAHAATEPLAQLAWILPGAAGVRRWDATALPPTSPALAAWLTERPLPEIAR